jgi:pyruvyltransferase
MFILLIEIIFIGVFIFIYMNVYYWTGKKNFGDLLTDLLIKRFTGLSTKLVSADKAELVMVGSILEHLPKDFSGVIAGCGKLHEKTNIDFPNAKILALRGPLTAGNLKDKIVIGDPGLLADELVPLTDKKYDLGIVPHWTDTTLEHDVRFKKYNPKIIRVADDPLKVITEISQCKKIISSSLHGIITADAFGLPRRIEMSPRVLSHPHQEGGLYKWNDYSESIGMKLEIGLTQLADRHLIIERQHNLFDLFEEIKKLFS